MNNTVVKHIQEQVEELSLSIEMLNHEVEMAQSNLRQKIRRKAEKTLLRDELQMMIENIPDSSAKTQDAHPTQHALTHEEIANGFPYG